MAGRRAVWLMTWGASARFVDARSYAPGYTAKKHLMVSCRPGSSTVSAMDADGPVTVEGVAEGIQRASESRMIVGSHD